MKIKIKNRYWVIPNNLLNNCNISFKAKGLYAYIQSKSDDWDFSSERIKNDTKDGRDSIRAWLIELEEFWYLLRNKNRTEKWTWEIEYELQEVGYHDGKPVTVTTTENPTTENPTTENPSTNKERNTKKEIIKKNNIAKAIETKVSNSFLSTSESIEISEKENPEKTIWGDQEVSKVPAVEKKEYGNQEVNNFLAFLKKTIGVDDFKETQKVQRQELWHLLNLWKKIGKEEFLERLKSVLEDSFKRKNSNSITFLYKEIKSFIHTPVVAEKTKTGTILVPDNF